MQFSFRDFTIRRKLGPGIPSLIYRFEDFSLDGDRRELRRGGEIVAVDPQVFDVLEFLIINRERVVSNDDLIQAVWQGRIVSDGTVSSRIYAVRQALGDSGAHQRLIRTLPRKGYRFAGYIHPASDNGKTDDLAVLEQPGAPTALSNRPSIAVLPFQNMSDDPEQEYFVDGLVEEIITGLSRSKALFVIARNSSFTYKGRAVDVRQVGRELGVRYVLEGSVRKAGNRLRIIGQLVEAANGAHLWADRFDGDFGRHLRTAGSDHGPGDRRHRPATRTGGDRTGSTQDHKPGRLRLLLAGLGSHLSLFCRRFEGSAVLVGKGYRVGPRICPRVCDPGGLLLHTTGIFLEHRSRTRGCRSRVGRLGEQWSSNSATRRY